MYTDGLAGLGEEPGFFDAGGTFESITKVVASGVQTGMKIADQVKLYNQSKKDATAAQQLATSVQQAQQLAYATPVGAQPVRQSSIFDGWTVPLLIGSAGLVAFVALRK